jgi:hypothetical protein
VLERCAAARNKKTRRDHAVKMMESEAVSFMARECTQKRAQKRVRVGCGGVDGKLDAIKQARKPTRALCGRVLSREVLAEQSVLRAAVSEERSESSHTKLVGGRETPSRLRPGHVAAPASV